MTWSERGENVRHMGGKKEDAAINRKALPSSTYNFTPADKAHFASRERGSDTMGRHCSSRVPPERLNPENSEAGKVVNKLEDRPWQLLLDGSLPNELREVGGAESEQVSQGDAR